MENSTTPLISPPFLPDGGTVGVVSPSKWAEESWIRGLEKHLKDKGFKAVLHPQNNLRAGWLAGTDEARVQALEEMFADPAIHAIICARGGAGAFRLVDKLNYEVIRRNPKPFVGFSDATCLLNAIAKRAGVVTFHGPMGWNFGEEQFDPRTFSDLLNVVCGKVRELSFSGAQCTVPGKATGVLFGGNITLLQGLTGTAYAYRPKDGILFIEDTDEPLYKLDRSLTHLRMAGLFEGVRAVLVGEAEIEDAHPDPAAPPEAWYGKTIEQIVRDHVPANIPLAFNVPCGHGRYITTLPHGAAVEAEVSSFGVNIRILS